jgi:putative transposase
MRISTRLAVDQSIASITAGFCSYAGRAESSDLHPVASSVSASSKERLGTDAAVEELALAERGSRTVIPSRITAKAPQPINRALYAKRNLIERAFNRLKDYRRIATRFDKLARNFTAAIALTAIRLWYLIRLNEPAVAGVRCGVVREVSRLRRSRVFEPPFPSEETSDGGDQPSAPTHDRGHDGPQSVAGDATILRACGREVQPVFRPVAGPAGS